jgi:hypothetical protein
MKGQSRPYVCQGGRNLELASLSLLFLLPAVFAIIIATCSLLVAQTGPSASLSSKLNVPLISTVLLWSNQNPSDPGSAATFSAEVAPGGVPTPTGTVTFQDGSAEIGSGAVGPVTNANFLLFSSQFDNAVWPASDQGSIVTPNYSSSPLEDQTAYRYQNVSSIVGTYISQEISGLSNPQPVTFSIWLKSNTGGVQSISISIFDNDNYGKLDEPDDKHQFLAIFIILRR